MQWHCTIAGDERVALFPSEPDRLAAVRTLARVGGTALVLFCVVDDHVHLVMAGERTRVGQLAGNVSQSLGRGAAAPLEPARIRPVESRAHLESLVRYVLDQSRHHALTTAGHRARWPGSCFLDLVGARVLAGFSPLALREALPRLPREAVWGAVGLEPVEPAADDDLAGLGVDGLVAATQAAIGRSALDGNTPEVVRARRLVAALARRFGIPAARVADALGVTVRALHGASADPALERAVRLRVAVIAATADRPDFVPRGRVGDRVPPDRKDRPHP